MIRPTLAAMLMALCTDAHASTHHRRSRGRRLTLFDAGQGAEGTREDRSGGRTHALMFALMYITP
jgi:hypothetical protein